MIFSKVHLRQYIYSLSFLYQALIVIGLIATSPMVLAADFPMADKVIVEKEKRKLLRNLDGIRDMPKLPDALFVVDIRKEKIAVDEARKLKIPVIGIVDTNSDPDEVDYIIPGNDDALRAIQLFLSRTADAVIQGRGLREAARSEEASAELAKANNATNPPKDGSAVDSKQATPQASV